MYDYLIVGQGIAGTHMAQTLLGRGANVMVLDDSYKGSSSMSAAGIINPVTGRKYTRSWKIDELLPVAEQKYRNLEKTLNINVLRELSVYRSIHSIKEENDWMLRLQDDKYKAYMGGVSTELPDELVGIINQPHAGAFIYQAWQVDMPLLIKSFRSYLMELNRFTEANFIHSSLIYHGEYYRYYDLWFKNIIFCEGYRSTENPFFKRLPFDPVKGEALLIKINKNLKCNVRDKLFITPIGDDLYWVGASNEWKYNDANPTESKKNELERELKSILKCEYQLVGHVAGIRPATKSRRPFIGRHPDYKGMFILGGMGTKGASLSPYFAEHLVSHIFENTALDQEADIQKYFHDPEE